MMMNTTFINAEYYNVNYTKNHFEFKVILR